MCEYTSGNHPALPTGKGQKDLNMSFPGFNFWFSGGFGGFQDQGEVLYMPIASGI